MRTANIQFRIPYRRSTSPLPNYWLHRTMAESWQFQNDGEKCSWLEHLQKKWIKQCGDGMAPSCGWMFLCVCAHTSSTAREHVPIWNRLRQPWLTNLLLMTRTKLASVGFVAARNCMWQQNLDDAISLYLTVAGRSPQRRTTLPTPYWLLQSTTTYYHVLQSTTPVLLSPTKYYASTTPYYKELLQYFSVLQSATPVLLCATTHYSSTTLYYNALLQYYSVLQSTTPVPLCTTKY